MTPPRNSHVWLRAVRLSATLGMHYFHASRLFRFLLSSFLLLCVSSPSVQYLLCVLYAYLTNLADNVLYLGTADGGVSMYRNEVPDADNLCTCV
jgi:hypothetical protein